MSDRVIPTLLETPRLIIRRQETGDGAGVSEAIQETWDQLYKYAPWAKNREDHTPEKEETKVASFQDSYNNATAFMMGVYEKATGRFLGRVELYDVNMDDGTMCTGYWFRQSAMGQGFATEAEQAILEFGFAYLDAKKISAWRNTDNEASGRILSSAGFEETTLEEVVDEKTGQSYTRQHYVLDCREKFHSALDSRTPRAGAPVRHAHRTRTL